MKSNSNILNGFFTAFSMYSIIPMPQIEWNKNTMKYALCFFPLVGGIIGTAIYFWCKLCILLSLSGFLFAAGMVIIPLLISGAIHMDGFIDTSDALYSRRDIEKKLEILKDPHVGAFGVIMCVVYLIAYFGISGQLYESPQYIAILALVYPLSRSLSALSIVSFKTAKNTGLANIFSNNADKKAVKIVMIIYIALLLVGMIFLNVIVGLCVFVVSVVCFWLYKRLCYKQFGGITGDLAGYFVQVLEFIVLLAVTVGGLV